MTAEIDAGVRVGAGLQVGRIPAAAMRPELAGDGGQEYLDRATRLIKGRPVTAAVGAGGTVVLTLDGPALGYMYTIRSVSITDASSVFNAVAGTAWIFTGVPGNTPLVANNAEWTLPALPNSATWGSDELVLSYGEAITIAVSGATAGQVLMASYRFQLYGAPGRRAQVQV